MKKVLAIETSCDETGIALVQSDQGVFTILTQALNSQIDIHKEFGGVFPMVAKREHGHNLIPLLYSCIEHVSTKQIDISEDTVSKVLHILEKEPELQAHMKKIISSEHSLFHTKPDIDMIVVTAGPGLEPALWVGISFAKALSLLWNIPIMPINHMEGHIASILAEKSSEPLFPAASLLISGGHTEVVLMKDWGAYEVIGKTRDDAVGEAYDKVARILGLGYPGGPEISARAVHLRSAHNKTHLETLCEKDLIKLPRPMIHSKDLDFSFSGLKTAVLYLVRDIKKKQGDVLSEDIINLICYEFEEAVVDVLLSKLSYAKKHNPSIQTLVVAGGVIANTYIRESLQTWCTLQEILFLKPSTTLSTDNAVMIGLAGLLHLEKNYGAIYTNTDENLEKIIARGGWKIDEVY